VIYFFFTHYAVRRVCGEPRLAAKT
jgi:hypothetical protein